VTLDGLTVRAYLHTYPDAELHEKISALRFYASGYSDVRVGALENLDEVIRLGKAAGNAVWKTDIPFGQKTTALLGDPLVYASMFAPRAKTARLLGAIELFANTDVSNVNGCWVAWGRGTFQVTT
jgi:hypothetical protein